MLFPKQKPELVNMHDILWNTFFLVFSQASCIFGIYVIHHNLTEKPFIIMIFVSYAIVSVYVWGYNLDNSPLLSISSLFVVYIYLYFMNIITRYNDVITILFLTLLFGSAVIKDKYSHDIHNKKPICVNIILYIYITIMPYAIPFHINYQNKYYEQNLYGLQML